MRLGHCLVTLLWILSAVVARGEDQEAAAHRQRVFETWGDAWFVVEKKESVPAAYHRIQAQRCAVCDGKDWVVTVEWHSPLSTNILLGRRTLHVDDAPGLRLRHAVVATIDGAYRDSVRITYGDTSVRSEVETCLSASVELREVFLRDRTWTLACNSRLADLALAPKLAELMALDGTASLKLNTLHDQNVVEIQMTLIGEAEVTIDRRKEVTKLIELSHPGEQEVVRFWVSPERGLLQFTAGEDTRATRVRAETAMLALAELEQEAERSKRKQEEEAREPKPRAVERTLRIRMTCGPVEGEVTTTIEDRTSKDAEDFERVLAEAIDAFREAGSDFAVVIDADPKVPWQRVVAVMDACKKLKVTDLRLAPPLLERNAEPPEYPVYDTSWSHLNFTGVNAGDWVEYEDGDRRERVVLLKTTGKTIWIETNAIPLPTRRRYIVEIDAATGNALRAWRGDLTGRATAIKLLVSPRRDGTAEEKRALESLRPKCSNRTGSVARETLNIGDRELDCEKVTQDQDVEERNAHSPESSKYHDRWTTWYSEDVPPFRTSPGEEWAAQIKWATAPPSGKGAEVRMTRSDENGKVRWERRLVAWGNDGKTSLKLKELEEAR